MIYPKKKIFIIILSFAIIIAVCFIFFLMPSALKVKNTLSHLQAQQIFLEEISKRSNDLNSFKERWGQNGKKLKKIDGILVKKDEMVDLVMILEALSDKLSIKQEVSVARQLEDSNDIMLKNSLSGDFGALMKYIKGVENLKYIVEVSSCRFSKQEDDIKAELMLRIPIYKK